MIDRGINSSAGMLLVNPNAVSTNKSGLGDVTQRVSSRTVGSEIRNIILSKMRIDVEDTICVVGGEVIAIDAAFRASEGTVIAVEYNGKQRDALEDNVEYYDLRNVKILDRVDDDSMKGLPSPAIAFLVASASLNQEIDCLMKLNPHVILVVYTLDFAEAGKLRDLFESKGIKDAEVIRIGIDRLGPNNTFVREPAPWIVSGRIEKE